MKTKQLVATAVISGFLGRVVWSALRPTSYVPGEAFNVASALASGRGFADAYHVGQGATAHLLPISPLIAGGVYKAFAGHAAIAEAILATWSISLAMATYLMVFKLAGEMGCRTGVRLTALFFACIVPPYLAEEAVDFRVWEGGLALFLATLTVLRVVLLDRIPSIDRRDIVVVGILNAFTLFVNPLLGISCLAGVAILLLSRGWNAENAKRALTFGLSFAVPLTCLMGIWAHRNYIELGSPVLLRSNAGLELAVANHQSALEGHDPGKIYIDRLKEIHPLGDAVFDTMKAAGGEVPYFHMLGEETKAWIATHPLGFTKLYFRHLKEELAPEPWQFAAFGSGKFTGPKSAITSIVGVGGLAAFALAELETQSTSDVLSGVCRYLRIVDLSLPARSAIHVSFVPDSFVLPGKSVATEENNRSASSANPGPDDCLSRFSHVANIARVYFSEQALGYEPGRAIASIELGGSRYFFTGRS